MRNFIQQNVNRDPLVRLSGGAWLNLIGLSGILLNVVGVVVIRIMPLAGWVA